MSRSVGRLTLVAWTVCLSRLLSGFAPHAHASTNIASQGNQQYQAAAQRAMNGPFRVDVQPGEQGVKLGSPSILKIQLRNANNEVVNATEKMTFEVTTTAPSHAAQTRKIDIAPGSSAGEITLKADEAGLWKLEVREANNHLKSGSNYLLVSAPAPPQTQKSPAPKKAKKAKPAATPPGGARIFAPRVVLASYVLQGPDGGDQAPQANKEIVLTVSGEGDGKIRADGASAARVSVFLLSPQLTDVRIWLAVSQGQLAAPVLLIRRGQVEAEVNWTSTTPAQQAKVFIRTASPQIPGQDSAVATVDFVDPIVAIAFANPPSKLNIVELGTVAVRFIDRNAKPVQTHMPLPFSFSANSSHVHLTPASDQTKPGAFDFSTVVAPTAFGSITIEAAVPGFEPIRQPIQVTGMLLLVLCGLGGALGGLVNHLDRKQSGLPASLATGMVVALPITWLYVWIGLPNINAGILHNQFSAVMVAIIAGASGAGGLKMVAQKAGLNLFGGPQDQSSGAAAGAAATPGH
jgi:hypothetical protein